MFLFFLGTADVFAATNSADTTRKSVYFNSFLSGALIGTNEKGNTLSFQTTHGIRKNRFTYGLTIGFDSYIKPVTGNNFFDGRYAYWRSVPIAATITYDFFSIGENNVFISGSGGYSKIWSKKLEENGLIFEDKGGLMVHPSIGYRMVSANHHLYFNLGYKWQLNDYQYNYTFTAIPLELWPSVKETMERLTLTLGFGWN